MRENIAIRTMIIIVFLCSLQIGCNRLNIGKITDISIYKDTPVWELAVAVNNQSVSGIMKIAKNKPKLLNFQEPKYGLTLLLWAVGMEKFKSAEALLKCGADPNIFSRKGETPLFVAASYSWIDTQAKKDPKYVKLLLNYGANPNRNYIGFKSASGEKDITEEGTSPLMNSVSCGLEKTKALVEAGADINYKTKPGITAAITALFDERYPEYAYYLIVLKKARVSEPYHNRLSEDPETKFYPVDLLRDWVFVLNSKEHKMKMEIIAEFARQGVNYRDTEINQYTLEHIKKLYPNNWEDYIKKY
jgi:ankyrin repeat protein